MGVQSLSPRGETPFFLRRFRAIRLLPDTMPSRTGITYKILSREDPKKKNRRGLPWSLPELSKIDPLWA